MGDSIIGDFFFFQNEAYGGAGRGAVIEILSKFIQTKNSPSKVYTTRNVYGEFNKQNENISKKKKTTYKMDSKNRKKETEKLHRKMAHNFTSNHHCLFSENCLLLWKHSRLSYSANRGAK